MTNVTKTPDGINIDIRRLSNSFSIILTKNTDNLTQKLRLRISKNSKQYNTPIERIKVLAEIEIILSIFELCDTLAEFNSDKVEDI